MNKDHFHNVKVEIAQIMCNKVHKMYYMCELKYSKYKFDGNFKTNANESIIYPHPINNTKFRNQE